MAAIDRDKNLLFGIFAAQLKGVRAERIIEAGAAWATDPTRPLSDRLFDLGAINATDRELLDRLVAEAIRAHGGDASEALSRLGGVEQVERAFSGSLRVTPGGSLETVTIDRGAPQAQGPPQLNIPEETPGRYSRISVYGKGGMGRVLLVHDEHMDRDIAMKELLPHPEQKTEGGWTPVGHTASMVARFLREARLTGLLEHPSIVPVYELGKREDGSLYYTMKLVRGKTFLQAIRAEKLLEGRLKLLPHFLDLCQAIAYAHSRGIIHRDLKPANVMIGDFGETVVLDWGIAKSQGAQDIHENEMAEALTALKLDEQEFDIETRQGEALGTPHYMPPEQAQGRVEDIDKRSDVYSLGAVLYELLTAKTPYSGRTTREILQHVIKDKFQPVRDIVSDAPPELVTICEKCLSKDPEARFQSAKELSDEVERFLSGALVRSFRYSPGQLLRYYYRRHRAVLNTALAGAAALLLLAVYSYISLSRAYLREQDQRQQAEDARDLAEDARAQEQVAKETALRAGEEEKKAKDAAERQLYLSKIHIARQSIEQRRYDVAIDALESAPAAYRHWEWGYYNRLCHLDEFTLRGHQASVTHASYSPDGHLILTASDDKTARLWNPDTGDSVHVLRGHEGEILDAEFSPDGTRVATASEDGTARIWIVRTGENSQTLLAHEAGVASLRWNSSGTQIVTASDDGRAIVWNAEKGDKAAELIGHTKRVVGAFFTGNDNGIVTASIDGTLRTWDANSGQEMGRVDFEAPVAGIQKGKDDGMLVWTALKTYRVKTDTREVLWSIENPRITTGSNSQEQSSSRVLSASVQDESDRAILTTPSGLVLLSWKDGASLSEIPMKCSILRADFSPRAPTVLAAGYDGAAYFVDLSGQAHHTAFLGHSGGLLTLSMSPDGTHFLTGSTDQTAKIWRAEAGDTDHQSHLRGHTTQTIELQVNPDGRHLASASSDGTIVLWDAVDRVAKHTFSNTNPELTTPTILFSPDGKSLLTVQADHSMVLSDNFSYEARHILRGHADSIVSLTFDASGNSIVSASTNGQVFVWNVAGPLTKTEIAAGKQLTCAAFDHTAERVIAGAADGTTEIWDAKTGKRVASLDGDGSPIIFTGFASRDSQAFAVSEDKSLLLWDVSSGKLLKDLQNHNDQIKGAALCATGQDLLTWSRDGSLILWDLKESESPSVFKVGLPVVRIAELSPDRKRLLTAAGPGGVKVFDVATQRELAQLSQNTTQSFDARFSLDGKHIFTTSDSGVLVYGE